jgi:hypothetical protein
MARELTEWLQRLPSNRIDGAAPREIEIDEETTERLRSLGYIN